MMHADRIKNIFNGFVGTWCLERRASDQSVFSGSAVFTPIGDRRLDYKEHGDSVVNGVHSHFHRSYIYELQGERIVILYNDPHRKNETLHELEFHDDGNTLHAVHRHVCALDHYDIDFTVGDDKLEVKYRVNGPHKNYTLHTVLTREKS